MLYCNKKGTTTCCFHNHECEEGWNVVNDGFQDIALKYLTDKVASGFELYLK